MEKEQTHEYEMKHVPHLVFRLDDQQVALKLDSVDRVVRMVEISPLPGAPEIILGIIDYHGGIIPVVNFRIRFGKAQREIELGDQLIITHIKGRLIALAVDQIVGVIGFSPEEIISVNEILSSIRYVDGFTRHEDELILIHDLDRLLSTEEHEVLTQRISQEHSQDERKAS